MSRYSFVNFVLSAFAIAAWLTTTPIHAESLGKAVSSGTFSEAMAEGAYLPHWSNGLLLHIPRSSQTSNEPGPNLAAYDRTGKAIIKTRMWVPDAWKVIIRGAAASTDGNLAVIGTAYTNSGIRAGFLGQLLPSGAVARITRTYPFEASEVCFGPDGSLWLLGQEVPTDAYKRADVPDHAILHHYGSDGRLMNKFLQRSVFNAAPWHPTQAPEGYAHIVASKDRIGLLTVGDIQWIEMRPDGSVIGTVPVKYPALTDRYGNTDPSKLQKMTGFAMTADNNLYASFQDKSLYRLDRLTGRWSVIELGAQGVPADFAVLLGADGGSLVYGRPQSVIAWSEVLP